MRPWALGGMPPIFFPRTFSIVFPIVFYSMSWYLLHWPPACGTPGADARIFSPRFSGENGSVSCTCSVYVWGGSLVGNNSNFRLRIGRTYYFKMQISRLNDADFYHTSNALLHNGQNDYLEMPRTQSKVADANFNVSIIDDLSTSGCVDTSRFWKF